MPRQAGEEVLQEHRLGLKTLGPCSQTAFPKELKFLSLTVADALRSWLLANQSFLKRGAPHSGLSIIMRRGISPNTWHTPFQALSS